MIGIIPLSMFSPIVSAERRDLRPGFRRHGLPGAFTSAYPWCGILLQRRNPGPIVVDLAFDQA